MLIFCSMTPFSTGTENRGVLGGLDPPVKFPDPPIKISKNSLFLFNYVMSETRVGFQFIDFLDYLPTPQ